VPRLEGMTNHYIDSFGVRWVFEFEIWDGSVEITDVHLNGNQIPGEMIAEEWIKEQEDRIECAAFGYQVHS